ncbi:TonB-dependent receptor [Luteolibacter algae]|uniref:TonB-dependent receptor n=1 Tax=Luteolibacter algae TaxID=454151 RepID=A0ABW5D671_9BACT
MKMQHSSPDTDAKPSTAPKNLRNDHGKDFFVMTGTLLALSQLGANAAPAAPEGEANSAEDNAEVLPELVIQADGSKTLYKPEKLTTGKYTVPLVDVPQTVNVVSKEVIKEQGATSLREVLKNVPSISIQAGEGGVPPGDNLSIRGFNARTDLFVDGVRDFGGYSRDPFNIEQVEVAKGPSSTNAGRGSTGGSVNLSSKTPHLGNAYGLLLGGGSDSYGRATLDVNQEIKGLDNAAFRLNAMLHSQDTPDRDHVSQERWGIAPSISFGLETDTRLTLSYFHLEQNNVPDYGLPWVSSSVPGLSPGLAPVRDSNWYGLVDRDFEDTKTDIFTAIFEHDFNENLRLSNVSRYGRNEIDLSVTAPRFVSGSTDIRRSDWKNRDQTDTILSNQTDLRYDFQTGTVKHELIASMEFSHEESENRIREDLNSASLPDADLYNPNPFGYTPNLAYTGEIRDSEADTIAFSLFDTVKLNEKWILSGGLRWESFDVDYDQRAANSAGGGTTSLSRSDEMLSYRAAVTYKPRENGSVYLGYGTSFNPSAEGLTLSDSATSSANINTDPEENRTIELGTKWDLLDERLLVNAAVFRTDKTNARTQDPADPSDFITLDGEQRVQGFEFGFTGLITDEWRVLGGYTYLDSEVRSSADPNEVGLELSNTPRHSFNLWSVYDLPKGFQVGLGANYVDSRTNSTTLSRLQTAPSYVTFDALVGYQLNENVSFRLNVYNLADKDYVDRVGGGHYIPGAGRSATLTAEISF